jgi:hypothetical protein
VPRERGREGETHRLVKSMPSPKLKAQSTSTLHLAEDLRSSAPPFPFMGSLSGGRPKNRAAESQLRANELDVDLPSTASSARQRKDSILPRAEIAAKAAVTSSSTQVAGLFEFVFCFAV